MHQAANHLRFPDFGLNGQNGLRGLSHVHKYGVCVERIHHDDPNGIQPVHRGNGRPCNGDSPNAVIRDSAWGRLRDLGRETSTQSVAKPSSGKLIHVKPFALSIRVLALLGALALGAVGNAQAAAVAPDSAFTGFMSNLTGTNKQTVTYGSNGTPIVGAGVPNIATAGGAPTVTRTGSLPLGYGVRLPITTTAKVAPILGAALLKKGMGALTVFGVGVALYDTAKELGFTLSKDGAGNLVVQTAAVGQCSSIGQTQYRYSSGLGSGIWSTNSQSAAQSWASVISSASAAYDFRITAYGAGTSVTLTTYNQGGTTPVTTTIQSATTSTCSAVAPLQTVTEQALQDAIASASGWPSGSAVSQALVDAANLTGDDIPVEQPKVTGPATVDGPSTVSNSGSKETTKKTQFDCTYVDGATVMDGGSVVCTERVTTTEKVTTVDPITGTPTTSETVTDTTTKPAEVSPDPEQTECQKNPSRIGCAEFGTADPQTLRKEMQAVTVTPVNFGSASGCPAPLSRTFAVLGHSFSWSVSYQPLCDQLAILKALFLVMAAFLSAYVLADSFKVS